MFADVLKEHIALSSEDRQATSEDRQSASYSADDTGCRHRAHELRTAFVGKSDIRS